MQAGPVPVISTGLLLQRRQDRAAFRAYMPYAGAQACNTAKFHDDSTDPALRLNPSATEAAQKDVPEPDFKGVPHAQQTTRP